MIEAVSTVNTKNTSTQNKVNTSIFYINDVHGKMTNMERIYTAAMEFDAFTPSNQPDKLKLASGDIILGEDPKSNKVANKFLDWAGFMANALGNHEMDVVPQRLAELMEDANYKLLAANVNIADGSPMKDKIQKSTVIEQNGHQYGIIGIAPSDVADRVKINGAIQDISVENIDDTIKSIQEEVDKFKEQGINKIILLSHSGFTNDKRIAQETDGIDIIHGGHTHNLIEGVKHNENFFFSKAGEPVVITQGGKDGETIGILNIEWDDDKGIITKVQNNLNPTRTMFNRTLPIKFAVEKILGKSETIGTISKATKPPKNRLIEPNPHAYFITDAMKNELGTDIALLNAANIRGHFTEGSVDTRLMADITPFKNKMVIAEISEPEIIEAIKNGAKSMNIVANKPGLLIPSGMNYIINKNGELKSLNYIDREGKIIPIDINNPDSNKIYTVAMDDFCATGGDNYFPKDVNPEFIKEKFDFDKDFLACDYMKKIGEPVEIKDDGRIVIVED